MAWDLLNRAYTIGTIDAAQDITPGVAQTGFRDFSTLANSDITYVAVIQNALWSYMQVQKVGAVLRPQTYYDGSNGEGNSVTFSAGVVSVFSDLGKDHIVYNDSTGVAQNADGVLRTFSPETLVALKIAPIPASGKTVAYMRGVLANDHKGGLYVWEPAEATAGDDFNYVVSSLSATGRWVRQKEILELPGLAADADAYSGGTYKVSNEIRDKSSTGIVKKLPRVERFHQGEFITFAEWKAMASAQWATGDTFVFRGITGENDLGGERLTYKWDPSNTDTASLDIITIRPDDISGSNPGRAVLVEPGTIAKFTNSDATPSLKASRFHRCADTVPAAITALDDMVDLRTYWIFPGAQAQVFTHGASLLCPGGTNFTLGVADSPIIAVSDNGVVSLIAGGVSAARLASTANAAGASLIGIEDAAAVITATNLEAALLELRKNAFIDGGTVAAAANVITVAPRRRYQLTASDSIQGVAGLADGEFCQIIGPATGSTTLVDGASPGSGQALALSGTNVVIQSSDEAVYTLTRVGAAVRLSGGGEAGLTTQYMAQSINAAATFNLFDAGVAGKLWEVTARHATDPDIYAKATCLGDATDPVLEPPDETIGALEFSFSGTTLRLGNTSASNGTYNILIKEMF